MKTYVIGIDYGTDSCRGMLVDTERGQEVAAAVFEYPRWKQGLYCDPEKSQYRQHPLDYIEGLHAVLKALSESAGQDIVEQVVGISVDTTGSTPCVVDEGGQPLALRPEFAEDPDAMFVLWKDHTAVKEAEEITRVAKAWARGDKTSANPDYTRYIGGVYSSEWYFAKLLHIFRRSPAVKASFGSFVEHCDYIPAYLTGVTDAKSIQRSRCAAGHKAMWHQAFDGLPPNDFLAAIDPHLDGVRAKLYTDTFTADHRVGYLAKEIASQYGFSDRVAIGIGAFDCHMGAVGGNIHTKALVKVIGTSTCDIMIQDYDDVQDKLIEGICGQVDGSVVAGKIGLEAGQSAFGDFYAWFKRLLEWPLELVDEALKEAGQSEAFKGAGQIDAFKEAIQAKILQKLEAEASLLDPSDILTIDWINGRRTPFANQNLKAAIMGLDLSSDAPKIYHSIIEATVFGARLIVDQFMAYGFDIEEIVAIGGVAKKSKLAMQMMADVTGLVVKVSASDQAVALGAACFAAVVGGVYPTVEAAQAKMASDFERVYRPNPDLQPVYAQKYQAFKQLSALLEANFY